MNGEEEKKPEEKPAEEAPAETPAEVPAETPVEEPKAEEVDKLMDRLAEKIVSLQSATSKKSEAKKKAIFEEPTEVRAFEPKVKYYRKKNGEWIYLQKSEAEHLGNWFKYWARFKKTHRPDHFEEMKKEFDFCEKMAYQQKLEPLQVGVAAEG